MSSMESSSSITMSVSNTTFSIHFNRYQQYKLPWRELHYYEGSIDLTFISQSKDQFTGLNICIIGIRQLLSFFLLLLSHKKNLLCSHSFSGRWKLDDVTSNCNLISSTEDETLHTKKASIMKAPRTGAKSRLVCPEKRSGSAIGA